MKISEASNQTPELTHPKRSSSKSKSAGKAGAAGASVELEFAQALAGSAEKKVRLELDELMQAMEEQGQRLARSQKFEQMQRYRELVMAFMDRVVNRLYKIQAVETQARSQGRVQVVLKKVDENLEALMKEVLSRQATPLRILEKVGQIRGLLLDLYK